MTQKSGLFPQHVIFSVRICTRATHVWMFWSMHLHNNLKWLRPQGKLVKLPSPTLFCTRPCGRNPMTASYEAVKQRWRFYSNCHPSWPTWVIAQTDESAPQKPFQHLACCPSGLNRWEVSQFPGSNSKCCWATRVSLFVRTKSPELRNSN